MQGRFRGLGFVFDWPLLVGSLPFKFLFFRCQPTVASATSPLRLPSFAFLANIFARVNRKGESRRIGNVVKEVEEATGGVNLQSSGWIASKISDIDGGEGDNGRQHEREIWIGRSGNRRSSRAIVSLAFIWWGDLCGWGRKKFM